MKFSIAHAHTQHAPECLYHTTSSKRHPADSDRKQFQVIATQLMPPLLAPLPQTYSFTRLEKCSLEKQTNSHWPVETLAMGS